MKIILLLALVPLISAGTRRYIINQQDLSTCDGDCSSMPWKYNIKGCTKVYSCYLNTPGWDAGFLRCDYCNCACDISDNREKKESIQDREFNQDNIYRNCKMNCPHSGLVRTEHENCNEIRNCRYNRNGWNWWFWRCDYCICNCVTYQYISKYTLTNLIYDMSATAQEQQGQLLTIAQTILENQSDQTQSASRKITVTVAKTESITTSVGIQAGISVEVKGSVGVDANYVSVAVAGSLSTGVTYEKGTSKTSTFEDWAEAKLNVPPKSYVRALIVAHKFKVTIPYRATMVQEWTDKTTTKKAVSGVYTNVSVGKMRVTYDAAKPL